MSFIAMPFMFIAFIVAFILSGINHLVEYATVSVVERIDSVVKRK
jgi:hypothetical protein